MSISSAIVMNKFYGNMEHHETRFETEGYFRSRLALSIGNTEILHTTSVEEVSSALHIRTYERIYPFKDYSQQRNYLLIDGKICRHPDYTLLEGRETTASQRLRLLAKILLSKPAIISE